MGKLSSVKMDIKKVADGIWQDYRAGMRLLIAHINNPAYAQCLTALQRPYLRQIRTGTLENSIATALTCKAVAKHILVGWENVNNDDGNPIPYSSDKAFEIISDPAYSELYNFVLETAVNAELYRAEVQEDSAKNLPSA
jgi:hypothetical protein